MKKSIFLLFIIVLPVVLFSQSIILKDTLRWMPDNIITENGQNKEKLLLLNFSGALHEQYGLPFYLKTLEIDDNLDLDTFYIRSIDVQTVQVSSDVAGINYLDKEFDYNIDIFKAGRENVLSIKILPLRRTNTGIQKINSFEIEFVFKKKELKKSNSQQLIQSALSSGKWYKIAIPRSGVYKISYDKLRELGFSHPENVRIFGNDAGQLPFYNNQKRPVDLRENKVLHTGNSILFYAKATRIWKYDTIAHFFTRSQHFYSDTAYYFITDLNTDFNNDIQTTAITDAPVRTYQDYDWFDIYEKEFNNVLLSGRLWLAGGYSSGSERTYKFDTNYINTNYRAKAILNFIARGFYTPWFYIDVNGEKRSVSFPVVSTVTGSVWAYKQRVALDFPWPEDMNTTVNVKFECSSPSAVGYLDDITLNAKRKLVYNGQTDFRFVENAGSGQVSEAVFLNSPNDLIIWDVTNSIWPENILLNTSTDGKKTFRFVADTLREFVAFTINDCYEPIFTGEHTGDVKNQNLHATPAETQMLIITHPLFLDAAKELEALHENEDNINTLTVTTEEIYNEFSGGIPDAVAIRDYIRYVYNLPSSQLEYVILFGDGSYRNKPYTGKKNNPAFIPTYQTANSLNEDGLLSIVTDDFFVLLDEDEGETSGFPDLALGRIPVGSPKAAFDVVQKIKHYKQGQTRSDWINNTLLLADNGSDNTFVYDAENISDYMDNYLKQKLIDKVYLPAYEKEATIGGNEFPQAVKDVFNAVQSGTSVFTFLGHGNYQVMTAERVVTMADLASWNNYDRLFLLQSGTCNFGRFDIYFLTQDKNVVSGGEYSVLNPNGGAIAAIATTRYSYTSVNYQITSSVLAKVFSYDSQNERITVGEALRQAKISAPSYYSKIYTLLGDPAIVLNPTSYKANITQVRPDTIKALSKVQISGEITDLEGNFLPAFDGMLWITVLDKKRVETTRDGEYVNFWTQNDILFHGMAKVNSGRFSLEFIAPKDMVNYKYGQSKITAYVFNSETKEQGSSYKEIVVGGLNDTLINDNQGPEIKLYFNDTTFVNGGVTDQNPKLLVYLEDESGINTTKNDLGHLLKATLDGTQEFLLNRYYTANTGTYKSGKVEYNMYKIPPGKHTLTVEAYDVLNNKSSKTIEFVVMDKENFTIERLFNYPNPFTTNTAFYFEHNSAGEELEVLIQVYSVAGRLVKTIYQKIYTTGFLAGPFYWDGKDNYGHNIGKGVYFYKITVKNAKGQTATKTEKLLILH